MENSLNYLKRVDKGWVNDIKACALEGSFDLPTANNRLVMLCEWFLLYYDKAKDGTLAEEDQYLDEIINSNRFPG